MAFKVIKWVKGRPYLYEQSSFRIGGKVKTESRYLGAASPTDVEAITLHRETRDAVSSALKTPSEPPAPPAPSSDQSVITTKLATLQIKADLKRFRISEKPLRHWQDTAMSALAGIGIAASAVPPITVKHGSYNRFRRARFKSGYVVTMPKGKSANRNTLRTNFSKAVAASCIDALQKERPDLYAGLSLHFDQTYRATTRAVIQYIANSRDRWKWSLILTAWVWGRVPPVYANKARTKSKFITPDSLGLFAWGDRKDWRADAETALATVLRDGYTPVAKAWEGEFRKARATERITLQNWQNAGLLEKSAALLGRSKAKMEWKRASARVRALREKGFALETLQQVFRFET